MMVGTVSETPGVQNAEKKKTNGSMGKDEFLTLLVAQLKNQDPLAPMDNTEFTAQMATFSSLEQMFKINENLIGLQQISASANNTQALNLIGREVQATGNSVHVGENQASPISFSLPEEASSLSIHIMDGSGEVVRTIERGTLSNGQHAIEWDGRGDNGQKLSPGLYTFTIDAASAGGEKIMADTFMRGNVDAISMENGITYAHVGGSQVMISDISEIRQQGTGSNGSQGNTN